MATVQQHINDFRIDVSTDAIAVNDTKALNFLNRARRDIFNEIRKVEDFFFYNYFTALTTVQNQEEYTIQQRTEVVSWIPKIISVSIKYRPTDDFKKARLESIHNLEKDLDWYKINQSVQDPFYLVMDKSVFIYPAPTEAIENGFRIYWITDLPDVLITWTASDVWIPLEFAHLLPLMMKKYYYSSRNMLNEKNDAINEIAIEINKMKSWITRNDEPVISEDLNLYYLQ